MVASSPLTTTMGPSLGQYLTQASIKTTCVSTGSAAFDHALSGGIKSNSVYELSGLANSGKLQVTAEVVKNYLLQGKSVLWIDTSAKCPLEEMVNSTGLDEAILTERRFHHTRIDNLIQLMVLLKQLGLKKEQNGHDYALVVVNEFSDLIHHSVLMLEEELNRRRAEIERLRARVEADKRLRELSGETCTTTEQIPNVGPSIMVRQNQLMHQILGLFNSYNDSTQATTILLGNLNTSSQKLLIDVTNSSNYASQSSDSSNASKKYLKSVYQAKLIPLLGDEVPWSGLLEARILLYRDWADKRSAITDRDAETLSIAMLKFNRPIISKETNHPKSRTIKAVKRIKFRCVPEGIRDFESVQSHHETFELSDEELNIAITQHLEKSTTSIPDTSSCSDITTTKHLLDGVDNCVHDSDTSEIWQGTKRFRLGP